MHICISTAHACTPTITRRSHQEGRFKFIGMHSSRNISIKHSDCVNLQRGINNRKRVTSELFIHTLIILMHDLPLNQYSFSCTSSIRKYLSVQPWQ